MAEYPRGTASQEAIEAEASPETQKAIKEAAKSTAVEPLTTADLPAKGKKTAKKGRR